MEKIAQVAPRWPCGEGLNTERGRHRNLGRKKGRCGPYGPSCLGQSRETGDERLSAQKERGWAAVHEGCEEKEGRRPVKKY